MASTVTSNRAKQFRRCFAIAAKQHGLITSQQALGIGFTRSSIQRLVASGQWQRIRPGVFSVGGAPPSWRQSLMAACLAAPGVASGRAAGYLWGLDGIGRPPLEITIPRIQSTSLPGVLIHRVTWHSRYLTRRDRIPTTDPSLTLLNLAAVLPIEVLELALEDALRRSLTSLSRLYELLKGEGKGKLGCPNLRWLVEKKDPEAKATESGLETHIWAFLRRFRLPLPVRQFEVFDRDEFVARPDFAYPEEKVAIEGVSHRFHSGSAAWERDRERLRALRDIGWIVIEVTKKDLRTRPQEVADEIRSALESRGRRVTI